MNHALARRGSTAVARRQVSCRAAAAAKPVKVQFKVPHRVEFGQAVCVAGALAPLGNWSTDSAVVMRWNDGDYWTVDLEVPAG